jgi:xanthine dehydrogenase YagR molybdenum-binding subunit
MRSLYRARLHAGALEMEITSALAAPGVLDVITWRNAPRLHLFESNPKNRPGQTYLVLQDDQVRYYGQHLAIVVAETGEQAQYAASLLIRYSAEPSNTDLSDVLDQQIKPERITLINAPEVDTRRGDPEASFQKAPIRLDLMYMTQNPKMRQRES